MRRLEFLINEVRKSTDNKDVNGISTSELVGYFNDAQRYITSLIFKHNSYADFFKAQRTYDVSIDGFYELPDDVYTINAISMVEGRFNETTNNEGFTRIRPIMESEQVYIFGYFTRDNKVKVSGQNDIAQLQNLRITYFKKLPDLDVRQAKVLAVSPGNSITLDGSPDPLYEMDDHCSTVDDQGVQAVNDIYFTNTAGGLLLTADTDGVAPGQFIVAGKNSANISQLPDACETYLLDYVRQRIYTRNNYDDAGKQMYFTEQQKADIVSLFSRNKKDDDTIPVTDIEFLLF